MAQFFKRVDSAWARGEGWLIVLVLILMVLVAGFQAGVRNLTRFDFEWANNLLQNMDWADSLMRKGTLWLSFLGASLATYHQKHINMDPILRVVSVKTKFRMFAVGSLIAAIICVGLTYSFGSAVQLNLTERPIEYELLGPDGNSMHVCDASDAQLGQVLDLERPAIFCRFRGALATIGVSAETPGAAFQLIVPLMFLTMTLRFFGHAFSYVAILLDGPERLAQAEAEEQRRILAEQDAAASMATSGKPPPAA